MDYMEHVKFQGGMIYFKEGKSDPAENQVYNRTLASAFNCEAATASA